MSICVILWHRVLVSRLMVAPASRKPQMLMTRCDIHLGSFVLAHIRSGSDWDGGAAALRSTKTTTRGPGASTKGNKSPPPPRRHRVHGSGGARLAGGASHGVLLVVATVDYIQGASSRGGDCRSATVS